MPGLMSGLDDFLPLLMMKGIQKELNGLINVWDHCWNCVLIGNYGGRWWGMRLDPLWGDKCVVGVVLKISNLL